MQPCNMKRNKTNLNFKNFFKKLFIFNVFPVDLCLPWFLCTQQHWATAQPLPPHTQGIPCQAGFCSSFGSLDPPAGPGAMSRVGCVPAGRMFLLWACSHRIRLEKPSKSTSSNHSQLSRDEPQPGHCPAAPVCARASRWQEPVPAAAFLPGITAQPQERIASLTSSKADTTKLPGI